MARKTSTSNQDRYLLEINGYFSYNRRIPEKLQGIDGRNKVIRVALGTNDLAQARAQRDVLENADDQLWASMLVGMDRNSALLDYNKVVAQAQALGFTYRHVSSILATETPDSIMARIMTSVDAPIGSISKAAVLGMAEAPKDTISQALRIYLEEIAADEIVGKSPNQRRHWSAIKERAVGNFISVVGDKPIDDVTRDDGRAFYDFWRSRVAPAAGKPSHSANTGNRDLGNLRVLYSAYMKHMGRDDVKNPFDGFSFKDLGDRTRPPFDVDWIRERILAPGALSGLNDEARAIVMILIETGCRPSEICNLTADRIILNHDIPLIDIRSVSDPDNPREIKTKSSTRRIPLIGVALEAMKRFPSGFPRYKDKEDSMSAALNKFFKENGLFPTSTHKIYSFRHAFEDRMKVAGLDTELRMILMGHANDRPKYGQGGSMEWRRDELLKIVLPFDHDIMLSFTHDNV